MLGDDRRERVARLIAGSPPPIEAYDADIIILSLNRADDTIEAIQSARKQRGVRTHITILDQGSEDEMVRMLTKKFTGARDLAIYSASENFGVAGGRNLATSLGQGRFIVALDNDAVFQTPFVVAGTVRVFNRRPDVGAVAFNILSADGARLDRSSWGYPARLMPRFKGRFDTTTFVGAGHAIRRTTWNAVGGYDADLFFTWEEYDFCLSAIKLSWRIVYDGTLCVVHKVSSDSRISWTNARTTYFVRNRLLISRKWGGTFMTMMPRILGYVWIGWRAKRLKATLKGINGALTTQLSDRQRMTKAMRQYVYWNEVRHRGTWLDKIRYELLGRQRADPDDQNASGWCD